MSYSYLFFPERHELDKNGNVNRYEPDSIFWQRIMPSLKGISLDQTCAFEIRGINQEDEYIYFHNHMPDKPTLHLAEFNIIDINGNSINLVNREESYKERTSAVEWLTISAALMVKQLYAYTIGTTSNACAYKLLPLHVVRQLKRAFMYRWALKGIKLDIIWYKSVINFNSRMSKIREKISDSETKRQKKLHK